MKSTSGQHFAGLDHLRAVAAFLVVLWHFAHRYDGEPVPFGQSPEVGLLDEGHAGVSLFMVLSGYLFARLVNGRRIHYPRFLWNRALRLLPLFVVALALGYALEPTADRTQYLRDIARGFMLPTMPLGGWSIIVEAHFYILLPLLLWSSQRRWYAPYAVVAAALAVRAVLALAGADMQTLSYYSLVGRIDQFALGIAVFYRPPSGQLAAALFAGLWFSYAWFDAAGGFYGNLGSTVWTLLPTVEAAGFAAAVSWYDRHPMRGRWLKPVERAGEYSYSIYLLHFLIVAGAATFVDEKLMKLTSIYVALPWALLFFAYMAALGWVSYRYIEAPFLRFRKPYLDVSYRTLKESSSVGIHPDLSGKI